MEDRGEWGGTSQKTLTFMAVFILLSVPSDEVNT